MTTDRIREKIKNFLGDRPRSTEEILEHINSTMRHGTTSQQLGNVLSKEKDIVKVGYTKQSGILSGGYEISEWATRTWVLSHCPGWEEGAYMALFTEDNKEHHYDFPGPSVSLKINESEITHHDKSFELIGVKPTWIESWNALLGVRSSVIEDYAFEEYFELRGNEYDVVTELDKYKFVSKLGDYCVYKNTIPSEILDRERFNETKRLLLAIKCYTWTIESIRKSKNPEKYLLLEFAITNNLGLTYLILKQFNEAGICFKEVKGIIQKPLLHQKVTRNLREALFRRVEDNEQLLEERRKHNNKTRSNIGAILDTGEYK